DIQDNEVKSVSLVGGGSGYAVGDIVSIGSASSTTLTRIQVASLGAGNSIATFDVIQPGSTVQPAGALTVTSVTGTGSGATFALSYGLSVDNNLNAGVDSLLGTGTAGFVQIRFD